MKKILFVCTGNICRSPSAEAVLRASLTSQGREQEFLIDSAGTHGYHIGERPDERAVISAQARGIDMTSIRARKVMVEDFNIFDLIIAMDQGHFKILHDLKPEPCRAELKMFYEFCSVFKGQDVPDPYYGGKQDFEIMMDIIQDGIKGVSRLY